MFNKKKEGPPTGEKFGQWGGPDVNIMGLPGGGAIQFDLDALTLGDFRQMRDHYQINSSLSVLTFLLHQMEYRIVCDNKKQEAFYNEMFANIWTPLVRSMSQSFWAGFSPNVLQWENEVGARRTVISKIKDLIPEDSAVNWKKVDGAGTNKMSVYDGIKQTRGLPIPVDNTFWYPLLMENGDYRGRKLMRPAFQPWFFSILLHLFANRYYERFGEPTPIGRAPFDDEIRYQGKDMRGNQAMELIIGQLRNRSVVVLPNEKTPYGDETNPGYDYQIEYLESQMRGADFERYMTRLDEEMSLALFTPILLMRTADVGSYNLGTQHSIIYQWMLNAIGGDWKFYIDWYILRPLRNWNFGENAPLPKIQFRKMGSQNEELVRDIVRSMVAKNGIKPDIDQLGEMAGLTLTEVKQLTSDEEDQPGDPTQPSQGADSGDGAGGGDKETGNRARMIAGELRERIASQVRNAYRSGRVGETEFSLGFQRKLETVLVEYGESFPASKVKDFYNSIQSLIKYCQEMEYSTAEEFMKRFDLEYNDIAEARFGA